jgi:hypothetical protein
MALPTERMLRRPARRPQGHDLRSRQKCYRGPLTSLWPLAAAGGHTPYDPGRHGGALLVPDVACAG